MTSPCVISYRSGIVFSAPAGITSFRVILLEFRPLLTRAEQRIESSEAQLSLQPRNLLLRVRLFVGLQPDFDIGADSFTEEGSVSQ